MQGATRVPVQAVQRGEPGTYVYVINANNTVSVRPVKGGPTDGGFVAVLSGLRPGETVVSDGTDRLRDGAAVTVPAAAGQAAPGSRQPRTGKPALGAQSGGTGQPDAGTQPGTNPPREAAQPAGITANRMRP